MSHRVWVVALASGLGVGAGTVRSWADGCAPRVTIASPAGSGDDFGRGLAAIGDINGDGWTDFAIGAPEDSEGGPHAGAVYLFSGFDGSLIRKIVGDESSLAGWSLAPAGDVNGDGVPDVLVGSPGFQPTTTNANTQPYKFLPLVKALTSQRVDFACVAGDSNHFFDRYGFDGGMQQALAERLPMYATPVHSPNENYGQVLARWGSFIVNSTGGPVGLLHMAPPFFLSQWDMTAHLSEIAGLNRFAYWDETRTLAPLAVFGFQVNAGNPIDLSGPLAFHITRGGFAGVEGYIAPEVHLADPPYTHIAYFNGISTLSFTGDKMVIDRRDLPPDPTRVGPLIFRLSIAEGIPMRGPAFVTWLRLENTARPTGFSFSTMWAVGGKSARDAAQFAMNTPISSLTHFFEQMRHLQGPDKKIVIFMNEGGNDRVDPRLSYHEVGYSNTPAGFRDNMTTVRNRILEVWNANGWPQEELYFMMLGYHVLSDFPPALLEDKLREMRQVCRDLAAEWPRSTCIDMSAFMTAQEATERGWYYDVSHAHLSALGFKELSQRIVNAMFTDVARPGTARVHSGADGSVLLTLAPEIVNQHGDELGFAVASGGDMNGDGVGDFIVGAPSRFNDLLPGRAYLCSGADGSLIRTLSAADGRDRFGFAVCVPGDVDGDGRADVAVTNTDDRGLGVKIGSASVWSSATGERRWRAGGGQGGDDFGAGIAAAGDLNGDAIPDVVVGIPGKPRSGPDFGGVRLLGGANGTFIGSIDGEASGDRFGAGIAAVGDVDGDSRSDIVIGAPGVDSIFSNGGLARVNKGSAPIVLARIHGRAAAAALGSSLAAAGVTPTGRREFLALNAGAVEVLEATGQCCTADFTGDRRADFSDYLEFLNLFEAADTKADLNADGIVDFVDYLEFLVRYEIGC